MRLIFFLLFPVFLSAQINRAYGIIEIGSFPTSSSTGPKFAYRPVDSSFYRWVSGNTWVKVVESSITQDTLYLTEQLGTTIKVSGDTINLTPYLLASDTTSMLVRYIERGDTASMLTNYPSTAGYGIIDGGKTWRADTTSPNGLATRLFTKNLPTYILADRLVRSNGTNLVAGNLSDNGTKLQALLPWQFQTYTTAGLPTGVTGYHVYNTTTNGPAWYQGSRWAYGLESTFNRGTAGSVPFFDANGQVTQDNTNFFWNNTTKRLGINDNTPDLALSVQGSVSAGGIYVGLFNSGSSGAAQMGMYGTTPGTNSAATGLTQFFPKFTGTNSGTYITFFLDPAVSGSFTNTGQVLGIYSRKGAISGNYFPIIAEGGFSRFTDAVGYVNPNYVVDVVSTNAIGLPRGTVVQRPTIVTSTTPIRFNTDSTSIEYGESVGTWRQLATRAYARSLVSALPTTNIYTADGTLTSNRTLTGAGFSLTLNTRVTIGDSLKVEDMSPNQSRFTKDIVTVRSDGWLGKQQFLLHPDTLNLAYKGQGFGLASDNIGLQFTRGDTTGGFLRARAEDISFANFKTNGNFVQLFGTNTSLLQELKMVSNVTGSTNTIGVSQAGFAFIRNSSNVFLANNAGVLSTMYGTGTKEAIDLSKTQSNYIAGFATDGTILDLERKRDTTIYIDDTDYDFSAAITTAQIASRFNRVIFWMTTTGAAGSDSEITLHTPDVNLMQVEYVIHSVDEAGGFSNKIVFGTNNAVDSTNGLVANYFPAAGQGVHVRAGLRSGVYKYRYY